MRGSSTMGPSAAEQGGDPFQRRASRRDQRVHRSRTELLPAAPPTVHELTTSETFRPPASLQSLPLPMPISALCATTPADAANNGVAAVHAVCGMSWPWPDRALAMTVGGILVGLSPRSASPSPSAAPTAGADGRWLPHVSTLRTLAAVATPPIPRGLRLSPGNRFLVATSDACGAIATIVDLGEHDDPGTMLRQHHSRRRSDDISCSSASLPKGDAGTGASVCPQTDTSASRGRSTSSSGLGDAGDDDARSAGQRRHRDDSSDASGSDGNSCSSHSSSSRSSAARRQRRRRFASGTGYRAAHNRVMTLSSSADVEVDDHDSATAFVWFTEGGAANNSFLQAASAVTRFSLPPSSVDGSAHHRRLDVAATSDASETWQLPPDPSKRPWRFVPRTLEGHDVDVGAGTASDRPWRSNGIHDLVPGGVVLSRPGQAESTCVAVIDPRTPRLAAWRATLQLPPRGSGNFAVTSRRGSGEVALRVASGGLLFAASEDAAIIRLYDVRRDGELQPTAGIATPDDNSARLAPRGACRLFDVIYLPSSRQAVFATVTADSTVATTASSSSAASRPSLTPSGQTVVLWPADVARGRFVGTARTLRAPHPITACALLRVRNEQCRCRSDPDSSVDGALPAPTMMMATVAVADASPSLHVWDAAL